jgi:hypothetical protein
MKYLICKIQLSATLILTVISLIITSSSFGAILTWDANSEADLAGYNLYYGTSSQNYSSVVYVGNVTNYNLNNLNLNEGVTYYMALSSYDTSGNESDLSEELDYFVEYENPEGGDNCPEIYNPDQEDTYPPGGNGIGDACECEGDFDCDGDVDGEDSMRFKTDLGRNAFFDACTHNDDPCNGDFDCDGDVDGINAALFKRDFGRNQFNNPCPSCEVEEWCIY